MKVSIVTISFNQAHYLEQAMESVLGQDYGDIEYIVVDAGSTDGSREIIERSKERIAEAIFESDDGPAHGLNKGLKRSTGEIFGYLNSDDALLPGAIREVVEAFRASPDADVIYGHGIRVSEASLPIRRLRSAPFDLVRSAFGSAVLVQQATFYRRSALQEVGGFRTANQTCWDYELLVDLALKGKTFRRVEAYWAVFRAHARAVTNTPLYRAQIQREEARIFARIMGRSPRPVDRVRRVVARLQKWALDPRSFLTRLAEVLHLLPSSPIARQCLVPRLPPVRLGRSSYDSGGHIAAGRSPAASE